MNNETGGNQAATQSSGDNRGSAAQKSSFTSLADADQAKEIERAMTFECFSMVNRIRCESPNGFNHALSSWSTSDWFTALVGELGEAANVAKKLNRIRDGVPGNKETEAELRDKLRRELGDSFVYLDLLAQALGFNIGAAAVDVFNAKSDEIGCSIRFAPEADEQADRITALEAEIERLKEAVGAANSMAVSIRAVVWETGISRDQCGDRTLVGLVRLLAQKLDEARENRKGEFALREHAEARAAALEQQIISRDDREKALTLAKSSGQSMMSAMRASFDGDRVGEDRADSAEARSMKEARRLLRLEDQIS